MKELLIFGSAVLIISVIVIVITAIILGAKSDKYMDKMFPKDK